MAGPASTSTSARAGAWALALVLLAALAMRVWFAQGKGLVLDEFHSWFHATRPDFASFLATLRADNHPPLSFLVIAWSRDLFGDAELALRAPAIVFGMLELVLVGLCARRLGGRVALLACALLAASSLHLDFSTQARMYALFAVGITGACWALVRLLERDEVSRGAQAALALGLVGALHAHYFAVQYVAWSGLLTAVALGVSPTLRPRARALVAPLAVAVLACLPWYLTGLPEQLSHDLPPGGDDLGVLALAEAYVHLFFLNVRLGGGALRLLFLGGGLTICVLGAAGLVQLWRERTAPGERFLPALLGALAFIVPPAAWLVAGLASRSGFTWHYVLPSSAALAVLAATGARGRLGRAALGYALACAALLCVLNARGVGSEDYPGAIRHVLDGYQPGDAVIAVELQPALFPQGQPWSYYAPRLADDPPTPLVLNGVGLNDPSVLDDYERVWLVRTVLTDGHKLMKQLRERFPREERTDDFGFRPEVHLFSR